jgi:hypothetical protein
MSYLDAFLRQHTGLEHEGPLPPKLTKPGSVGFGGAPGPYAVPPTGLAVLEVLTFPAALLSALPLASSLVLHVWGVDRPVTVATHSACPRCDFDLVEWRAMIAIEQPEVAALAIWARRKQHAPAWRLAVEGVPSRTRTVGAVLEPLGAELRAVVIEGGA